jgi:hypothetical protein
MLDLVESWLGSLAETGRNSRENSIGIFEAWLRGKGHPSLEDAVRFQKKAAGEDRFKLADLVVKHVKERGGTYSTMKWRYATVRSFFMFHRADLPTVRVNWQPTKDATIGRLNIDILPVLLVGSTLRDRAIYLSFFQGLMDQHRFFTYFNMKGFELGRHVKETGVLKPFRIDFLRGRKQNRHSFNTWLGRESLEAWKLYFERIRGYPKQGEPAAIDNRRKALRKEAFVRVHTRRLARLKIIQPGNSTDTRYGYNIHEFRDLARSVLEKAKGEGFNTNSAEFWMGHNVDSLFYNKIWKLDPEYNLKQFKIAEKYLSILSNPPISEEIRKQEDRMKEMQERLAKLEAVYTERIKIKES